MGKMKEMYAPLTRWQYFTKTLYHDPSKTQEFEYDGVIYLKSQELQDIEERNARVNWVLLPKDIKAHLTDSGRRKL